MGSREVGTGDVTMSALHDGDQEATDHGNLMDLEIVKVERESMEVAGSQGERRKGETAKATEPSTSHRQMAELIAEEHAEAQDSVT